MAITSLIFHKITRWQEDQPSEIQLCEQAPDITADHEGLFSQLKKVFQFKAGKFHGQFDEDYSSAPYQNWLKEQLDGKISFEKLTLLYMNQLKELVDKTSESFEANILSIHEERADGPRVYIFALENNSGLLLNSSLNLDTVDYLNTSKMDLALRIDLDDWLTDTETQNPYLCMVRSRSKAKIGEAFTQSIGFKSSIDSAKETETLMEVLAGFTKESEPKQAAQLHQKAYDFCVEQQQLGEAVPINELSGYLDENEPTRFVQYAEQEAQLDTSKTLRPDTRKLKHLVRISGKGNGLSLSFSSDLMQQTILFDEQSNTLTITEIPKSLKKQILEHIKDKQEG
jgi:nucleoid-associated protein